MLCNRVIPVNRLARYYSLRQLTKAELIPLIKKIHPDLYHNHGEEVSAVNKRCVQNLYEIAEFLRISESKESKGGQDRRLSPLRTSYCMDFYMEGKKEAGGLREIRAEINPNKALCESSVIKGNKLDIALQNLKIQLGQIYSKAGLLDPLGRNSDMDDWGKGKHGIRRGRSRIQKGIGGVEVAEIDRIIYERIISRRYNQFYEQSKSSKSKMQQEAESFLRSGSVLVQNMSPIDEVQALDRLKNFLVDYGTFGKLSSGKESALQLVIRDSVDIKGPECYPIEATAKDNRIVIEIPKDFKAEKLLKTLVRLNHT